MNRKERAIKKQYRESEAILRNKRKKAIQKRNFEADTITMSRKAMAAETVKNAAREEKQQKNYARV